MTAKTHFHIEVVYALPHDQPVFKVIVTPESTVPEIIEHAAVLDAFPDINLSKNKVGIFSRQVKLDAQVRDGDRIEIYRPLVADPKEIRRRRAEQAKNEGKANPITGSKIRP